MPTIARLLTALILAALALNLGQPQESSYSDQERIFSIYRQASKLYRQAEDISRKNVNSEQLEESLNQQALDQFQKLAQEIRHRRVFDSLFFHVALKSGVLLHYFDQIDQSKKHYYEAIDRGLRNHSISDSLLFQPYLYLSIILFQQEKFDSAVLISSRAEEIAIRYPGLPELERLYNTLGVLYYQTGDYQRSVENLKRAMASLPVDHPYRAELLVNYRINLAGVLTKLGELEQALNIYDSIRNSGIHSHIVNHNTGVIHLQLGAIKTALDYLNSVDPAGTNKTKLYNDLALAYLNAGKFDSTQKYLDLSKQESLNQNKVTIASGQREKLYGELMMAKREFKDAIQHFHLAIMNFYPAFQAKEPTSNPGSFSGYFSYTNLFEALVAKAEAYDSLYHQNHQIDNLVTALDAYSSAFELADYIERSYNSEDARLFLNRSKYKAHSRPMDISIFLYQKTQNEKFLNDAYMFDQRNKGSVVSLAMHERDQLRLRGGFEILLEEEKKLRQTLTRLSSDNQQLDDQSLKLIEAEIRKTQLNLSHVQKAIYGSLNAPNYIPSLSQLTGDILNKDQAFISYHFSEDQIIILLIRSTGIKPFIVENKDSVLRHTQNYIGGIKGLEKTSSQKLYELLVEPINEELDEISELILNPDDELNYVPFESLVTREGNYLVEDFTVQYAYSASILSNRFDLKDKENVLALAPFSHRSIQTDSINYSRLPFTQQEISGDVAAVYYDSNATKEIFLNQAENYSIIHLATHAYALDDGNSFISFFPHDGKNSHKLFENEIYGMDLTNTDLVILSACETAKGELVRGEGLMSLARAFAIAGCRNIISSMWQAEDQTTAYILKRFNSYLRKDKSPAESLRQAKIDLLNDDEIDPRFKHSWYWSHLIYIGTSEQQKSTNLIYYIIALAVTGGIVLLFVFRKTKSR